ncbi:MAG: magnesium transporter CorA family protein [Solirubrobacteraceae bacterium]
MRVLEAIDQTEIARLRAANEFFWLDLMEPAHEQVQELGKLFDLHPIVIEDLDHFDQRPKIDDYERFLHIVFYGIEAGEPIEVHVIVHGDAMITVRNDHCATLLGAKERVESIHHDREEYAVYRVLDALTDSFFPYLEQLDDEIDELEERVIEGGNSDSLHRIVALKRKLTTLRRLVGPQRDILGNADSLFGNLEGFTGDGSHDYFRDVYDHLLRINDSIESFRDVLTGLLDVQLSAQSNRLNQVITRLTIIGTVFIPLTWVTGFFGQNFGWMTEHIDSAGAFFGLGLGLEVVSVAVLMLWFRRARLNS